MARTDGGTIQPHESAALEHAIDDGLREILIVQHMASGLQRFIRREDHRPVPTMPLVDDMEEHVGAVVR